MIPTDWRPPGSSVHGILQARILEWAAIPFSRGFSWPGDQTQVSYIAGRFFMVWASREAQDEVRCLLMGSVSTLPINVPIPFLFLLKWHFANNFLTLHDDLLGIPRGRFPGSALRPPLSVQLKAMENHKDSGAWTIGRKILEHDFVCTWAFLLDSCENQAIYRCCHFCAFNHWLDFKSINFVPWFTVAVKRC